MERHFTVSGFLSHEGRTALHWHRLGLWLPPGGHIQPDEDPIEAVVREIEEETGLAATVVPTTRLYPHELPRQLPPPVTIGVYDIDEPGSPHQHIDFVYFTRPASGVALALPDHALPALPDNALPALPDNPLPALPDNALPALPDNGEGWRWVDAETLRTAGVVLDGPAGPASVPEDVRRLALDAIAAVEALAVGVA